jgi:hypothetical protein
MSEQLVALGHSRGGTLDGQMMNRRFNSSDAAPRRAMMSAVSTRATRRLDGQ